MAWVNTARRVLFLIAELKHPTAAQSSQNLVRANAFQHALRTLPPSPVPGIGSSAL